MSLLYGRQSRETGKREKGETAGRRTWSVCVSVQHHELITRPQRVSQTWDQVTFCSEPLTSQQTLSQSCERSAHPSLLSAHISVRLFFAVLENLHMQTLVKLLQEERLVQCGDIINTHTASSVFAYLSLHLCFSQHQLRFRSKPETHWKRSKYRRKDAGWWRRKSNRSWCGLMLFDVAD